MERLGERGHKPIPKVFRTAEGRKKEVTILASEHIGQGNRGRVYRVTAQVGEHAAKPQTLVLKEFARVASEQYTDPEEARKAVLERAGNSIAMYKLLREAGVDTWATYRLSETDDAILMTDGELTDNDYVMGYGNPSESKSKLWGTVPEIAQFEDAINAGIQSAVKAASKGISLPADCWFMRVHKGEDGSTASFFVGDLDLVSNPFPDNREWQRKLPGQNLFNFSTAIANMLEVAMGIPRAMEARKEIEALVKQAEAKL